MDFHGWILGLRRVSFDPHRLNYVEFLDFSYIKAHTINLAPSLPITYHIRIICVEILLFPETLSPLFVNYLTNIPGFSKLLAVLIHQSDCPLQFSFGSTLSS